MTATSRLHALAEEIEPRRIHVDILVNKAGFSLGGKRNALSNFAVSIAVYFGWLEPLLTANLCHQLNIMHEINM